MGKVIYLFGKGGQTVETKNNGVSEMELRLEQIKKDYYRSLKGKQDTVKNYSDFLINSAENLEDCYALFGY